MRLLASVTLTCMLAALASAIPARAEPERSAQENSVSPARPLTELTPGGPGREPVDATRLDVARLPPEAAQVSRSMYDQGLFLEAQLGALTFGGDAREVSNAGPRLAVAVGYELTRWLALVVQLEGSLHQTDNRQPPAHTAYHLAFATVGPRLSVPIDVRFAIWAAAQVGVVWSSGDVLRALDFRDAFAPGVAYGGELGFDWHLRARHHSLGVLAGARHLPSLERDGFTVGAYGSAYLRYVF
jgi:hypothetical protein